MENRLTLSLVLLFNALCIPDVCSADSHNESAPSGVGGRKPTTCPALADPEVTQWARFDHVRSYEERTVALRKSSDIRPNKFRAIRVAKTAISHQSKSDRNVAPVHIAEQSVGNKHRDPGAGKATSFESFPEIPPTAMVRLVQYNSTAASSFQQLQAAPSAVEELDLGVTSVQGSRESIDELNFIKPLSAIAMESRHLTAEGGLPENKAMAHNEAWGTQYNWEANSNFSFRAKRNTFPILHRPLYFEDPNLERCGASHGCLTDVASMIHFAGRIPAMPYLAAAQPPRSCVRAKPDCPACQRFGPDAYFPHPGEIDVSAAAFQAAVTVGVLFLIP